MAEAINPQPAARVLKTARHPFFPCAPGADFLSVREGVPVEDAMRQSMCMLDSAIEILYAESELIEGWSGPAFGALYLLDAVKGIMSSCMEAVETATPAHGIGQG